MPDRTDSQPSRVVVIGYGTMGRAIVSRLRSSYDIFVISPHSYQHYTGPAFATLTDYHAAYPAADCYILAVKPAVIASACQALSDIAQGEALSVLSIAAGISVDSMAAHLPKGTHVARLMPNLAVGAQITEGAQTGACGLFIPQGMDEAVARMFQALAASLGPVFPLQAEEEMHALTALSGSGPAYFLNLCDLFACAATRLGMDTEMAHRLAAQTLIDSAALLTSPLQRTPKEWVDAIAVPGGTTQAGLTALNSGDALEILVEECLKKAQSQSSKLAENP